MTYTSSITTAGLRLRESRIIAGILLQHPSRDEWRRQIIDENVLQAGSAKSAEGVAGLLRARLEPLGEGLWRMVRDGDHVQATQACFAGAVKQSRLLGDFLDIAIREQLKLFAKRLDASVWNDYLAGCRGRDPDMPEWSEATIRRLRSSVFSMLAAAGYVSDTRSLELQNVYLDPALKAYLRDEGESYVLRCMKVCES